MKPTIEDKNAGLKMKYRITHADGSPCDADAEYFVLRLDHHKDCDHHHIRACRKAVVEYAKSVAYHLPQLSIDLMAKYSDLQGLGLPFCEETLGRPELIQWHTELKQKLKVKTEILKHRVENEDATNMGLALSRCDLAGQMLAIETQISMLGQIIRGQRL